MRYGAWDTNLLKTVVTMRYSHVTDRYHAIIAADSYADYFVSTQVRDRYRIFC